jgi:GMP synthase-like glutamine amidotransferase
MRGTGTGAQLASLDGRRPRPHPRVVVWEADGSPHGGVGYGHAIRVRLAAAGVTATTVPLSCRRPTAEELAAPVHVLSGGMTPATSRRPWVRSARRDLEPVLVRALAGEAVVTGICFGAQLIAATLAGPSAVRPNPRGIEAGLALVRPPGPGPGLDAIGDGAGIVVSELHYHHIEPAAVAALGGRIALSNDYTTVQAFTIGPTIVGLQFHPELDPAATRATVRAHGELIRAHGGRPAATLASIDRLGEGWRAETFDRFVVQASQASQSGQPGQPLVDASAGALEAS